MELGYKAVFEWFPTETLTMFVKKERRGISYFLFLKIPKIISLLLKRRETINCVIRVMIF